MIICPCCNQPTTGVDPLKAHTVFTPTELKIIKALPRAGVIATEDLIDRVYGDDPDGGPEWANHAIYNNLSRIRKKLRPLGYDIAKTNGHGYRLERAA